MVFPGRKRKLGIPWAIWFSWRACMSKTIQNQSTGNVPLLLCLKKALFDFRVYLGETERMEFKGGLVKRYVCFDIIKWNKAHAKLKGIIEAWSWTELKDLTAPKGFSVDAWQPWKLNHKDNGVPLVFFQVPFHYFCETSQVIPHIFFFKIQHIM